MFGSGMGSLELQALVGDANTAEKWSQEGAEKCTYQLCRFYSSNRIVQNSIYLAGLHVLR
jgi:hypothetical protein